MSGITEGLRETGTVFAAGGGFAWWRLALAWEPGESLLVAACEGIRDAGTVARRAPAGVAGLGGLPPPAGHYSLAVSPDGRVLWAPRSAGDPGWALSDVVDLATGTVWGRHQS